MKRETIAKISAVVITIALVAILLSQIRIGNIGKTLASIGPIYVIIGFVLYIFSYFFRALRFHILLNNKVSIRNLGFTFQASMKSHLPHRFIGLNLLVNPFNKLDKIT